MHHGTDDDKAEATPESERQFAAADGRDGDDIQPDEIKSFTGWTAQVQQLSSASQSESA